MLGGAMGITWNPSSVNTSFRPPSATKVLCGWLPRCKGFVRVGALVGCAGRPLRRYCRSREPESLGQVEADGRDLHRGGSKLVLRDSTTLALRRREREPSTPSGLALDRWAVSSPQLLDLGIQIGHHAAARTPFIYRCSDVVSFCQCAAT